MTIADRLDGDALFESAPSGSLVTDDDGRILRANRAVAHLSGRSADELIGLSFRSLLTPASQLFYETRHLPVLRLRGRIDEVALDLRRGSGTDVPVLLTSVLEDDHPHGVIVRTTVFESSVRSEFERELLAARRAAEAGAEQLRVLYGAESDFGRCTSQEQLADRLADHAVRGFAATDAAVLFDDGSGSLALAGGRNPLDLDARPTGAGVAAMRGGHPVEVTAEATDGPFGWIAESLSHSRYESLTVVPLSDGTTGLGVLVLFYRRRPDPDDGAREVQRLLALQAAQTLRRLSLQAQLERLARHDQLTGLPNRAAFREELDRRTAGRGDTVAVIYFDLDGFKSVNDDLGHATGDGVLSEVATRVRAVVRDTDTVARLGGDEFVVLCDDVPDDRARDVAERIREAVRQPYPGLSHAVSASIGVAVAVGPDVLTADQILSRADAAMYRSKRTGRDRVTLDEEMPG